MKRYILNSTVTEQINRFRDTTARRIDSRMTENQEGQWVRWSDVESTIKALEDRIPELRIARLEKALGLVSEGRCPECGERTRDFKAPLGLFAPEAFATLRELGIDPTTGHRQTCKTGARK